MTSAACLLSGGFPSRGGELGVTGVLPDLSLARLARSDDLRLLLSLLLASALLGGLRSLGSLLSLESLSVPSLRLVSGKPGRRPRAATASALGLRLLRLSGVCACRAASA